MVVRSVGWFLMLPFLLYSLLRSISVGSWRSLPSYLTWVVVAAMVIISYRYAGDQWDSPRYRVAFLALQAAIVGWAWVRARTSGDPWLFRLAALMAVETLVFATWYAGRHLHTPRLSLWKTVGLGVALGTAGTAAALWRDRARRRRLTRVGGGV